MKLTVNLNGKTVVIKSMQATLINASLRGACAYFNYSNVSGRNHFTASNVSIKNVLRLADFISECMSGEQLITEYLDKFNEDNTIITP